MRRERNTWLGAPTVVAPAAVFLVGELGLPEEEVAVLAALSSYATAQYCPDVEPPSALVAAVIERARAHLGEVAAALPVGSVLLVPPEPEHGGEKAIIETTPAIAVATTAAYFEMAGKAVSTAKNEILRVAWAAHRATYDGTGREGELVAAVHGGLVRVVFRPGAAPRIERAASPAGLHLVVFQTGQAPLPSGWPARVRAFAEREPVAHARIIDGLRAQAERFTTGLTEGNATAAIASAGRYGQGILELATAASVPLASDALAQAMELAKEIGGVAKPTSVERGGLGIAMFATPEAASLFARACQPPLVPLHLELDRDGVRCLVLPQTSDSGSVHTPAPETGAASISAQAIVRGSVEDKTTEKTFGRPAPGAFPTAPPVVAQAQAPTPVSEPIVIEEVPAAPSDFVVIADDLVPVLEAAAEEPAIPAEPAAGKPGQRRWPVAVLGGVLVVVALSALWVSGVLDDRRAPPVVNQKPAYSSPPAPVPAVVNKAVPGSDEQGAAPVAPTGEPAPPQAAPERSSGSKTGGKPRAKSGRGAANSASRRAGKLTADDF